MVVYSNDNLALPRGAKRRKRVSFYLVTVLLGAMVYLWVLLSTAMIRHDSQKERQRQGKSLLKKDSRSNQRILDRRGKVTRKGKHHSNSSLQRHQANVSTSRIRTTKTITGTSAYNQQPAFATTTTASIHLANRMTITTSFRAPSSIKNSTKLKSCWKSTNLNCLQEQLEDYWSRNTCNNSMTAKPPKLLTEMEPLIPPRRRTGKKQQRPLMGVLVDAARTFFPLPWLYQLADFLAVLGYDLIHFRISDDQSFVIQLESHPGIVGGAGANATSFNNNNQVNHYYYSQPEIRQWVDYARSKGVSVIPEINLPSHAGGWQTHLVYPCANFICNSGYSIPLNVSNPTVRRVIEDILYEVLKLFTPLYLHLGGDEVWMSGECFTELGIANPNYTDFETWLATMVKETLQYPLEKVIRWETTGNPHDSKFVTTGFEHLDQLVHQRVATERAGAITHWWSHVPPPEKDDQPYFVSTNLYFDTCGDRNAFDIFNTTAAHYNERAKPIAIVAGTFELGPCAWEARNVFGKLLAVAMATTAKSTSGKLYDSEESFQQDYRKVCHDFGFPVFVCDLEGRPSVPTEDWQASHAILQQVWKSSTCNRLTSGEVVTTMRAKDETTSTYDEDQYAQLASNVVEMAKEKIQAASINVQENQTNRLFQHVHNYTGVTVDVTSHYFPLDDILHIIDVTSKLGFNLIHLRLVGNDAFPLEVDGFRFLKFLGSNSEHSLYNDQDLQTLVAYAAKKGMYVIPEVNVFSNAAGWFKSGLIAACPQHICSVGGPIPMDGLLPRSAFLVASVFGKLLQLFSTAPFVHLGSSDRRAAESCYKEAYPSSGFDFNSTFDAFQSKVARLMGTMGFRADRIIQWGSSRIGSIIHLSHLEHNRTRFYRQERKFLHGMSLFGNDDDVAWDLYQRSKDTKVSDYLGVIVDTSGLNPSEWNKHNVFGRLVAIASGLSSNRNMSMDEFAIRYVQSCSDVLPTSQTCSDAKYLDKADLQKSDNVVQLDKLCSQLTSQTVERSIRTEILV